MSFSFNEVDRRSWVLDHRAPVWSYQLCAGVTRIGDPQAFGLSPLFLLVILFGSFWGTKLAVVFSAGAGVYFTTRILALFADFGARTPAPRAQLLTLAALFVTSNFFLWHLLVGHFTFISFFFGLGIIFYTLEGYLHGLGRRGFLIGSVVAWQHYSGGFFHSTIYLLVPFFMAFALFSAAAGALGIGSQATPARPLWRRMADASAFHLCGLLLAAYKLIAVWQQQQANPRILLPAHEVNSLTQLLAYQLLPTLGPGWLIPVVPRTLWDIHEYSAFSLLPVALVLIGIGLSSSRIAPRADGFVAREPRHPLTGLVVLYGLVCSSLCWEPFELRPVSPAQCLPLSALGPGRRPLRRRSDTQPCDGLRTADPRACGSGSEPECLPAAAPPLRPQPLDVLLAAKPVAHVPTRFASIRGQARDVPAGNHPEAPILGRSHAPLDDHFRHVPDSAQRCRSDQLLQRAERPDLGEDWAPQQIHELVDARFSSPGRQCLEQSFYTENEIRIAETCPLQVRLNLRDLNHHDPPARVRYLATLRRFCKRPRSHEFGHRWLGGPRPRARCVRAHRGGGRRKNSSRERGWMRRHRRKPASSVAFVFSAPVAQGIERRFPETVRRRFESCRAPRIGFVDQALSAAL